MDTPRFDADQVTVAVLLPLPKERAAAQLIADSAVDWDASEGHGFSLCSVPSKTVGASPVVVALALQTSIGNIHAAMTVVRLRKRYKNLAVVIACGIAGGAPTPGSPEKDIYLGDIVVGRAIVEYDFGHQRIIASANPPGLSTDYAFEIRGTPSNTTPVIWNVINRLQTLVHSGDELPWIRRLEEKLPAIVAKNSQFSRPEETGESFYDYIHNGTATRIVRKSGRPAPLFFTGNLGSANCVLKDPYRRDALRDGHTPILAIEMEAAGLAAACSSEGLEFLVVRGICDYCDSNKNDKWQPYAAAVAAAFTHSVIELLPVRFVAVKQSQAQATLDPIEMIRAAIPLTSSSANTTEAAASSQALSNSGSIRHAGPNRVNLTAQVLESETRIRDLLSQARLDEGQHDRVSFVSRMLEVESLLSSRTDWPNQELILNAMYEIARAYHMRSQLGIGKDGDKAHAAEILDKIRGMMK